MIVSASYKTDIPAFYGEWFLNRLRAGYCRMVNAFNPKQRYSVSLKPSSVDGFVFRMRKGCGCYGARDIGDYGTCPHGCVYCYAVRRRSAAARRHRRHDPGGEYLFPVPRSPAGPARELPLFRKTTKAFDVPGD